jgi:hypothetical protein
MARFRDAEHDHGEEISLRSKGKFIPHGEPLEMVKDKVWTIEKCRISRTSFSVWHTECSMKRDPAGILDSHIYIWYQKRGDIAQEVWETMGEDNHAE